MSNSASHVTAKFGCDRRGSFTRAVVSPRWGCFLLLYSPVSGCVAPLGLVGGYKTRLWLDSECVVPMGLVSGFVFPMWPY